MILVLIASSCQYEKEKSNPSNLEVYVGNNTWMNGNDKITIENGEYRIDKTYNYYILKKENK